MAKKKTPRQTLQWPHEDLVELLAWLDHTIHHEDIEFLETAVNHLKDSRRKDCTLTQIEGKLRVLWNKYGIYDPSRKGISWKDDVFTNGSSCLVGLSDKEKEDTASALRGLEDGYNASHPFPSRRLRNRSRPADTGSPRYTNLQSSNTSRNGIPTQSRCRTQTLSLTPSTVKYESEANEKSPSQAITSGKRKRATPSRHLLVPTTSAQLSPTPRPSRAATRKQVLPATVSQLVFTVHDSEEEDGEERSSQPRSLVIKNVAQSGANSLINCEPRDEHNSGRTAETTSLVNNTKLETAVTEIKDLQRQLQQKDLEIRGYEENTKMLEDEVAFLQSVQSQRDKQDSKSFNSLIEEKDRSIQELKEKLKNRRLLGTFTKLLPESRALLGEENGGTNIVEGFQNVYSECKQILYRHDSTTTVTIPPIDRHDDLRLLICRGLELDPQAPVKIEKTVIDTSMLSFQAIVRALTISALREWIFETDFPTFGTETSNILDKYREHITNQDGANSLRNLDLAAKNSLIKDKHFRRDLTKKAGSFAIQLSQTLAPIFARDTEVLSETSWDGFATWGQDVEEWQERRVRFVDIFTKALEVKADSILNTEDYEMVMYPPGTQYDMNTMTVETMDGMIDGRDHHGRRIEFCVEAAIYSYQKMELQNYAPMSAAVVPSRNFMRKEASQRLRLKPIVKAVVILKDEPSENRCVDGVE